MLFLFKYTDFKKLTSSYFKVIAQGAFFIILYMSYIEKNILTKVFIFAPELRANSLNVIKNYYNNTIYSGYLTTLSLIDFS
jgi:hypothetical protein